MTNSKATKKALFMSMLSLLLCFTMLMGATFAWFTDTVTSKNNIIKSGNLDVEMYWADGDEDPTDEDTDWQNAASGAIFDYDNWEPGFVQARHLKIKNVGSLAFKYQLRILADGVVSKLANVIDVYYVEVATPLTRDSINNPQAPVVKLGTLSEVLNNTNANALTKTISDMLEANKGDESERTLTLAFKMQESAGNEYQNISIGSAFRVELMATQVEVEEDSFDNTYDKEADFAPQETPSAMVSELSGNELKISATAGIGGAAEKIDLDAGYKFEPTETYAQATASKNAKNHVDFVVYADKAVKANSLALAGYYDEWCQYNNDNWVSLTAPSDIAAGEKIRLVQDGVGATVNYEEICYYGNDGKGFQCGVKDLDGSNKGTTITVELRMYETEEPSDSNGNSTNVETGNSTVLGTFTHTFGGKYETLADGTELFKSDEGEVVLYDTQNVTATSYTVPDGVTTLGNYSFSYTDTIEEVTLSSTVRSLGQAFNLSKVEKVTLNEGLEQIDSRAFKETTALKEVVISSTVKTIADNAFQKTWLKEIVIPATVDTIGETAFGASKIEKVTIEGNTSIQGYAFRGCPNLREVYLNGENVTFIASTLNGRNSMWFCNGESNNPNTSNITFYVKNDTVAARVKVAMGAEANNTTVYVNGVLYEG